MTQFLNVPATIQPVGTARLFTLVDTVAEFDDVITEGFMAAQQLAGHVFYSYDFIFVQYVGGSGWFGLTIDSNSNITLVPASETQIGNVIAGANGIEGYVLSYPPTLDKGSLKIQGEDNTANYQTTISNREQGQAGTVWIPDPGNAQGNFLVSLVDTSLTPVGAYIEKDVTFTAAALASAGHVTIQASSGTMQFQFRSAFVNASTGLSGGGGNRLLVFTDGTTVYNNAGVTAALLGTPINTPFGGSGNPVAATNVAQSTVTQGGATLYGVYSGGTTDFTTGQVIISFRLQRVA